MSDTPTLRALIEELYALVDTLAPASIIRDTLVERRPALQAVLSPAEGRAPQDTCAHCRERFVKDGRAEPLYCWECIEDMLASEGKVAPVPALRQNSIEQMKHEAAVLDARLRQTERLTADDLAATVTRQDIPVPVMRAPEHECACGGANDHCAGNCSPALRAPEETREVKP